MPDYFRFSRRLKELLAGESQYEVAAKLGYTQGRISQLCRGEKPSREFVERLVEKYDLDRDEWLELAGFIQREPEIDPMEQVVETTARRVLDEVFARLGIRQEPESGEDAFWRLYRETFRRLEAEGIPMLQPQHSSTPEFWESLTVEQAEAMVTELEQLSRDEHARRKK